MRRLAAVAVICAFVATAGSSVRLKADTTYAEILVSREVYLMGTRARLSTYAPTREAGLATLESALGVLEDAEDELSTWRPDSDISRLNRHLVGQPWQSSPRLCRMLAEVFDWQIVTGGAFDPAIGRLLEAWNIHGDGAIPDPSTLEQARAASGLALLSFDRTGCAVTRRAEVTMDVGAFGKGEALDRVEAALGTAPWMIDLGGQISVGGAATPEGGWTIDLAHPLDRTRPVLQLRLTDGSLSTSAGSERDLVLNGTRIGHILDPRTGAPAAFTGSVTVWHRRGLAADVLSTALYVMGPEEGLRWAEDRGLAVCYLLPEGERVRTVMTRAFRGLITATSHRDTESQR